MLSMEAREMDAQGLNKLLAGRKILGVEEGTTHGWIVIHLDATDLIEDPDPDLRRVFLTVQCGGKPRTAEAEHHSTLALHVDCFPGADFAHPIRDYRD
jgi:hypothetical protein